jgi:CubicO group peptidase (beta-lactamase class C family)
METAIAELEKDPLYAISPGENPQGRISGEKGNGTGEGPSPMGFEVDPGDADSRYLEITSSSSRASARGMGAIMGMLSNGGSLNGTRIISAEGIENAIRHPVSAADRPNGRFGMAETIFVQGGWCVLGRDTYGWGGAGGSVLQFSPAHSMGFGYTCTGFAVGLSGDQDRVGPIVRALQDALNTR